MVARCEIRRSPLLRVNANVAYQATRTSDATSHGFVRRRIKFSLHYLRSADARLHTALMIARAMAAC
jgi:hypothetical protein